MLEAPVYAPSKAYHAPFEVPFRLRVDTVSLEELRNTPATWQVVLKHAPLFEGFVQSPEVMPYLDTMDLGSFIAFGLIDQAQIDAVAADLARLPRAAWPPL